MELDLIAQPVVDNQFWILKNHGKKIGMLRKVNNSDTFILQNQAFKRTFTNIDAISFVKKYKPVLDTYTVFGYPTDIKHFSKSIYDVKNGVPLFTKRKKSECWYAAGYYGINLDRIGWVVEFCPKLITLKRYDFIGPFAIIEDTETFIKNAKNQKSRIYYSTD